MIYRYYKLFHIYIWGTNAVYCFSSLYSSFSVGYIEFLYLFFRSHNIPPKCLDIISIRSSIFIWRGGEPGVSDRESVFTKHLTSIPTPPLHSKYIFAYLTLQEVYRKSKQRFKCWRNQLKILISLQDLGKRNDFN